MNSSLKNGCTCWRLSWCDAPLSASTLRLHVFQFSIYGLCFQYISMYLYCCVHVHVSVLMCPTVCCTCVHVFQYVCACLCICVLSCAHIHCVVWCCVLLCPPVSCCVFAMYQLTVSSTIIFGLRLAY
jgi:hypothetical protein